MAAVAATGPQIGTDPQWGASCGDAGGDGLAVNSKARCGLLEALSGRSKVKQPAMGLSTNRNTSKMNIYFENWQYQSWLTAVNP